MGLDITRDPVRKIPLPLTPDAWAAVGAQSLIPEDVIRLRADGGSVRYTVVPYTGVNISATPVDAAGASVDVLIVKIRETTAGAVVLEQLASTVETSSDGGTEAPASAQITEDDMSPSDQFVIGFRAATAGTAGALWVFIDAGADRAWS